MILFDVLAIGAPSLLPSGIASRVLIVSVLVNPVDAVRTAALLGAEETTAFGTASLAFFRFTGGPVGVGLLRAGSLSLWVILPPLSAFRQGRRADF